MDGIEKKYWGKVGRIVVGNGEEREGKVVGDW